MSKARHSMGTLLYVNANDDGSTFVQITDGEVIDITGPEALVGEVKATHLGSPNFTKERKPGLKDEGKITLKMAFTNNALFQLRGYRDNRSVKLWKITYPLDLSIPESVNAYHQGSAFIAKLASSSPDAESEERILVDVELATSGTWTFTKAT